MSPYTEITVFEQSRNERLLADAFADLGREVMWGHRLEKLDVETSGPVASVTATLAGPDGEVVVRARYCVGADGSHSPVRESLGIPFEGVTNAYTYYIADAADVTGLADDAVNLRWTSEHFLLAFPMGGGRMRLLGIVRDRDLDAEGQLPEANVRALVRGEFGVEYGEATWFTTYRVHHRLAARFRDGPCFLVGDAAHIHSPVGAQGMNTGLQEAHNLACALADVIVGGMPDARLDRYEDERRPVGKILVATTDRAFGRVTSDSRFARFVRGRALPFFGPIGIRLIPRLFGGRLFGYVSQTRIHYRMSPRDVRPPRPRGGPPPAVDGRQLRRAPVDDVAGARLRRVRTRGARDRLVARARSARVPARPVPAARPRARLPRAPRRVRRGRGIRSRRARRAARVPGAARGLSGGCGVSSTGATRPA